MGLVTEADENAAVAVTESRIAARQAVLDQVGLLQDVIGLIPVNGAVANSAINVGSTAASQVSDRFGMTGLENALDQDYEDIARVRNRLDGQLTATMANYEYAHRPDWDANAIAAASGADFFVEGSDQRRPIKPIAQMSDDEIAAYNRWINSSQVLEVISDDRTTAGERMLGINRPSGGAVKAACRLLVRTRAGPGLLLVAALFGAACSDDDSEGCGFGGLRSQLDASLTDALAREHYEADQTWTTGGMIEATTQALGEQGDAIDDPDFFVDTEEGDRRQIKLVEDMTDDELAAYNAWLNSELVQGTISEAWGLAMSSIEPDLDRLSDRYCD